jgi:hypothetical protein
MEQRRIMKKIVILVVVSLVSTGLFSQQINPDTEVIEASDALLSKPNDAKAWQTFQKIIRSESYTPDIRSRVMYIFAVKNLLQMNTNLFAVALQKLQVIYPEEGVELAGRLTPEDWLVTCQACEGSGVKKVVVPTAQRGPTRCMHCLGTGKIVQLSPRVNEQLGVVLNEVKACANENIQFAEASKKALAEYQSQRRVAALKEIVRKYAHRTDLDEVKQALTTLEAELAKVEAEARKKEAEKALREKEDKDYQSICSSLENLPISGIPVMTREIEQFVQKYPKSDYRLELEITKAKLEKRSRGNDYMWKGVYVFGGLVFIAFCYTVVKGLLAGRKKAPAPLTIPGLDQSREVSDPLAGSFTDSDQTLNK